MTEAQILILAAGATGFAFLTMGGFMLMRVLSSASWVKTDGRIVSSRLNREAENEFRAHIEFEYIVDGRLYFSSQWRLAGSGIGSEVYWQPYLRQYPKGKQVTVYYDPKYPQQATIERNRGSLIPYLLLFGGICFLAGAVAAYLDPGMVRPA